MRPGPCCCRDATGTGTWLLVAFRDGRPSWTTHSIVGAIVAFCAVDIGIDAMRYGGVEVIDLRVVGEIFVSRVVTIPAGAVLAIVFIFLFKSVLP